MKKALAMLVCTAMTASLLAGCGTTASTSTASSASEAASEASSEEASEETSEEASEETADEASEETAEEGAKSLEGVHLVVGISPTYANFETTTDDGNGYEGIDIEILAALADECGFDYEISNMAFASLIAALQANQVDFVISGMTASEERKESVDFSQGYFTEKLGILFKTEDGFQSSADLNGKTVSCANGENYENKIPLIEGATLTTFENGATAIQELIAGRTDAVMTDGSSCEVRCAENPGLSYFIIDPVAEFGEEPQEYAIAFPKNSEYYDAINDGLGVLIENGTVHDIVAKWLGEGNAD